MPTISDIKPAGGGDYTSLSSWETAVDGGANADEHARCFTGGNLGSVVMGGWVSTPTSSLYARIYTELDERHDGTTAATGAYIDNGSAADGIQINAPQNDPMNYMRIEGIRFVMGGNYRSVLTANSIGQLIDSNVMNNSAASTRPQIHAIAINDASLQAESMTATIRNNLFYAKNNAGICLKLSAFAYGHDATATFDLFNNTALDATATGISYNEITFGIGTDTLTVTSTNNISLDCADDFKVDTGAVNNGSITQTYCCASDATASTWGGSGNVDSATTANVITALASDGSLKDANSDAFDAGTTVGSFDWDATHETGDDWRAQGAAWDMGALEAEIKDWTGYCRNNCVITDGADTDCTGIHAEANAATFDASLTMEIYNNTIFEAHGAAGDIGYGIRLEEAETSGTATVDATIENNVMLDSERADYQDDTSNGTLSESYNLVSDSSTSGTNGFQDVHIASHYAGFPTNITPIATGWVPETGKTLSPTDSWANDMLGDAPNWADGGDTDRPDGAAWDMGCLELEFTDITADRDIPFDAKGAIGPDRDIPFDLYGNEIMIDRSMPFDAGQGLGPDRDIPLDAEGWLGGDGGADRDIPFDARGFSGGDGAADIDAPFDAMGGLRPDRDMPFDALADLAPDRGVPFDALADLQPNRNIPIDASGPIFVNRSLPFDAMGAVAPDRGLPIDVTMDIYASRLIPIDAKGIVAPNRGLPFDAAQTITVNRGLPVDYG